MTRTSSTDRGLASALEAQGMGRDPRDGISDRVGEIYVMLTWRCNLRCRMCPMWGDHGFCVDGGTGEENLTVDDVVAFVDGAPRPRAVTISGGEPLLSDVCAPLIRSLADRDHRVMLTTNGTMLDRMEARDISRLHQVNLSIDGPPLVLEKLGRGGEDTLVKAVSGLAHVQSARRGRRPHLKLLTVITSEGASHLSEMLELFSAQGVAFDSHLFQHQMFLSSASAREHERALEALLGNGVPIWQAMISGSSSMDTEALIEEMRAVRRLCPDAVFSPDLDDEEVRRYYTQESWVPDDLSSHCLSPWFDVAITPDGLVWICPGHPVGSIHESGFEEIWNGEPARRLRRAIAGGGIFPGCRACFYLYNYRNP